MRRPSMTISNEPTTLSDAIAKANSLYNLGLPLLKDLSPGTTLYAMWQLSVTIQQPGSNANELMVITATEDFAFFGGLSGVVKLTIVQGGGKDERGAVSAKLEFNPLTPKRRPRASRSRR